MAERPLSPDPSTAAAEAASVPLRNARPFSRSAAKRESVQLLGSIRDLQLRFSHTVALEHRAGSGLGAKPLPGLSEGDEEDEEGGAPGGGGSGSENRPPGALGARSASGSDTRDRPVRRPFKDVELPRISPDDARREARELVGRLRALWAAAPAGDAVDGVAARTAFVATAQGVRRAKHLALAAQPAARRVSAPLHVPVRERAPRLISTPSRPAVPRVPVPRTVSYAAPAPERRASSGGEAGASGAGARGGAVGGAPGGEGAADEVGELRRHALDVLGQLRLLEEALRAHPSPPAIVLDDMHASPVDERAHANDEREPDAGSSSTASHLGESSTAPTSLRPSSALSAYSDGDFPDYADYDDDDGAGGFSVNALARADDAARARPPWEERLVGEARRYRSTGAGEWAESARAVRAALDGWADAVARIFEQGADRREAVWAVGDWHGRKMERVHAFLSAFLPADLAALLPPPSQAGFRELLLARLSDGYLAVLAHNAALQTSPRPWGFIPPDDMHDTLFAAAEAPAGDGAPGDGGAREREWTFRRTGNLTCWAAALRVRYSLPITLPPTAANSVVLLGARPQAPPAREAGAPPPSRRREPGNVAFDPGAVARREDGWERALAAILAMWVAAAAREHAPVPTERDGGWAAARADGDGVESARAERALVARPAYI